MINRDVTASRLIINTRRLFYNVIKHQQNPLSVLLHHYPSYIMLTLAICFSNRKKLSILLVSDIKHPLLYAF